MKILMSQMPADDWWGKGTPVYENNWSMEQGKIPNAKLAKEEHDQTVSVVKQYAELKTIPFPAELDTDKLYRHDAVFVRDSFISNQKEKIVMSNYSARERQNETKHLKQFLKQNGYHISKLSEDAHAEGGEFYYINNDNILFAGISRNNKKGVTETAKYLDVNDVCIIASKAYHLDTIFTVILNKTGKLAGVIACLELITNKDTLTNFVAKHNVPLLDIAPHDAIDVDGKGDIVVNCLPLPGVLIGGGIFETPGIEERIKQMGVEHVIAPVSQFHFSGGGTHCLTNELFV
jgi:N-dimethylarginine dimethylaminohydrolase